MATTRQQKQPHQPFYGAFADRFERFDADLRRTYPTAGIEWEYSGSAWRCSHEGVIAVLYVTTGTIQLQGKTSSPAFAEFEGAKIIALAPPPPKTPAQKAIAAEVDQQIATLRHEVAAVSRRLDALAVENRAAMEALTRRVEAIERR
jgi:hypothetical protein